mgnify:CR=1 FL=1
MAVEAAAETVLVRASENVIGLRGGGVECDLDRATGRIVRLVHSASGEAFVSAETGPAGLEVFDELDRKWYTDLHTPATVSDLTVNEREVTFVKRLEGAPFGLRLTLRPSGDGVRLYTEVSLDKGVALRSVRISVVLPVTVGLMSWTASWPAPADVRTEPMRYCYLADEKGKARTGIPMLTLLRAGRAGLTMCMPFEVPKVQLNMGVEPYDPTKWYVPEKIPRLNAGAEVDTVTPPDKDDMGERLVMRFTEKHVGLRPDRTLPFAMWFFGHEPDWRPALGRIVETYRDYFEPHPAFAALAGGTYGANPNKVDPEKLQQLRPFGLTKNWFHAHFEFHGEFLTDEACGQDGYTWLCEPYPKEFTNLTIERVRQGIHRLKELGNATFIYGFNMHCDETIIAKRNLQADVAKNEQGDIARAYHEQPVMYFSPDSPFGRHQLEQMDRLMRMYPEIDGVALDNWNYAGIDFGHDDGITMVNNKPAANLNFTQQRMIPAIAAKMHSTGRFVFTNKGRTIESFRGVDTVLTEAHGHKTYGTFAYMNLHRCVTPCEYKSMEDAKYAEYVLKYVLVWGGQPSSFEIQSDPEQSLAYKPLYDCIRNQRWVFTPDPLTLPAGCEGQIFRIDERSPWNAGTVAVTVVRQDVSWRDGKFRKNLKVKVRLPDSDRFTKARWIGVEGSAGGPVECKLSRKKGEITATVPAVGAAGVLQLTW